jgi:NADH-quinone oxidoreductase subunit H
LLFLIAEFLHMITASFLIVILFFGGWHLWGLTGAPDEPVTWPIALLRIAVLGLKIVLVILFFMLVRWSWPRFRFDQLMALAWKVMLPLGLVNLVTVAVLIELREQGLIARDSLWPAVGISWAVTLIAWIVSGLLAPFSSDNRPRRTVGPLDAERQLSA